MIGRRAWPRGVATLLAGLLACLVLYSFAIDHFGRTSPEALLRFAPQSAPAILQRSAQLGSVLGDAPQFSRASRLGLEALRKEPLSSEPLVMRGLALARQEDLDGADRLIGRALEIAPANGRAHLWFMYRALVAGRQRAAANEAMRLMEIMPSQRSSMSTILVSLAHHPDARRAIRTGSLSSSNLAMVMTEASRTTLPASALEEMLPDAALAPGASDEGGIRQLRSRMWKEGDFAGLLRLWRRSLGSAPLPSSLGPYDGDFRGLPGGPPFNWTLSHSDVGAANRTVLDGGPASTGLAVTQTGFSGGIFARQLTMLVPGAYRLAVAARSDPVTGISTEPFVLVIRCARPVRILGSLALTPGSRWKSLAQTFTVPPAGCGAQEVLIQAAPQDDGDAQRLFLTNMMIRRVQ